MLFLIPACSLSFGVAYAADEPAASDDTQPVAVVTAPVVRERSNVRLSLAGVGSLFWAAHHPAQAWKVLLPLQPDGVAYGDIKATCAVYTNASGSKAACP